jgi:hypothetical protein
MSYSDYLSDVALNNLRTAEASQMVYNVYENFIVPRICKDTIRTKADKATIAKELSAGITISGNTVFFVAADKKSGFVVESGDVALSLKQALNPA